MLGVSLSRTISSERRAFPSGNLVKDGISEKVLSINNDESILIGTKLGEVRLTYLGSCDGDRIRIGVVSPKQVEIYRRERTKQQRLVDDQLYQKELAFWRKELRRSDKNRRDHESLMRGRVDEMLLEFKSYRSISKKCGVSSEFVAKRQAVLEKNGSFETPLFDM